MFDIGFTELVLLAVISLLILGPERLPGAVRTAGLWLGRIRRSFNDIRAELEREVNSADLKQDLHNQSIMQQLKETGQDIEQDLESTRASLKDLEYELGADQLTEQRAEQHTPIDQQPNKQ